jgi:hypothetical protein
MASEGLQRAGELLGREGRLRTGNPLGGGRLGGEPLLHDAWCLRGGGRLLTDGRELHFAGWKEYGRFVSFVRPPDCNGGSAPDTTRDTVAGCVCYSAGRNRY